MKISATAPATNTPTNFEEKVTDMSCLPKISSGRSWYKPTDQGFEQRLRARLEEIRKLNRRGASNA